MAEQPTRKTQSFSELPARARYYILAVVLAGIPLLAYTVYRSVVQPDRSWLILAGLTVVAGCFAVKIPLLKRIPGSVSIGVGDFFVFLSLLLFNPAVATVTAAVEGLIDSLTVRVQRLYKYLFNVGQLAVSAALVGFVYQNLPGGGGLADLAGLTPLLGKIVVSGLLFFGINSFLIATAVALVAQKSVVWVWRENFLWASPSFLVNALTAAVLLVSFGPLNLYLVLAIVPLVLVTYYAQKVRRSRRGESTGGKHLFRFFQDSLPSQARGYLVAIMALGMPVFGYSVYRSFSHSESGWLYLAGLIVLSTCFPVRVPVVKERIHVTLSDVFVFSAMLHFGPEVAVVVAVVEAVTFNFRCAQWPYKKFFNLAQIALVAFVVGHVFQLLQNPSRFVSPLLLVAVSLFCGFLYFAISSGLVAMAVSTAGRQPMARVWRRSLGWSALTLSGAFLGAAGFLYLKEPTASFLSLLLSLLPG